VGGSCIGDRNRALLHQHPPAQGYPHSAVEVRPRDVVYIKSIWLIVMAIIKVIPESLFKRLRL
jgi:hypothetical protein